MKKSNPDRRGGLCSASPGVFHASARSETRMPSNPHADQATGEETEKNVPLFFPHPLKGIIDYPEENGNSQGVEDFLCADPFARSLLSMIEPFLHLEAVAGGCRR